MFSQNPALSKIDDNVTASQESCKTVTAAVKSLSQWFLSVETPFKWQPRRFEGVSAEEVIACAKEKAEFDDLALDKYVRFVTLVYEYTHLNKYDEAKNMITAANTLMTQENDTGGKKYEEFKNAMSHVLMATKAFLLATQGFETFSRKVYEDLIPLSAMTDNDLACIHAIKAKFFSLYRKQGFQQAVESSRKALELNPEEPMWMFLLAESLRRKEKYFPSFDIPMEELRLLEQAVARDRNARYLVHLALRYNNCAANVLNKHKDEKEFYQSDLNKTVRNMQHTATDLYKEALMLEPEDEIVNRRCGFGLMKASTKIARDNKHVIKSALDKALSLSPTSSMTLHYLGKYYKVFEGNEAKALDCFQRAAQSSANLPAHCDLIKLKFQLYGLEEYNPMQDFEIMLKQQEEIDPHNRLQTLCHIGSYYLFVQRDLEKALEYLIPVLEQDKDQTIIKYHKSLLMDGNENMDLCEILANEIKLTDEQKLSNKYRLMKLIANVSTEYLSKPVNENLIDNLMRKCKGKLMHKHRQISMKNEKSSTEINWRLRKENNDTFQTSLNNSRSSQPRRNFNNGGYKRSDDGRYYKSIDIDSNWRIRNDNYNKEEKVIENWRTEKTPLRQSEHDKTIESPTRRQSIVK